jgi:RNA polymerase sigma-70 factor (ECF subfamily)
MASDEDLVGRLADGDEDALGGLLARWDRPLHGFLARYTGGRDVEDLRQEVWMRVVRAAGGFDRGRRFSTWLFQIALNLCRDWGRRPPLEPLSPAGVDRALGSGPGQGAPPGDPAAPAQMRLDVGRLLAALPDAQRSAIILRYYHDLSEEEMARVLGCPRGTVKSRLHQAVRQLVALVAETDAQAEAGSRAAPLAPARGEGTR